MNKKAFRKELPLLVMLLPAVILVFIYNYIPFFGIVIAFQSYMPAIGMLKSDWVGFQNFTDLFNQPDFFCIGLVNAQYSLSTAAGLFKSIISCFFVVSSYKLADKFAGYRIF